jgi:glycosyltransferase involved in cell wall biosynthesis
MPWLAGGESLTHFTGNDLMDALLRHARHKRESAERQKIHALPAVEGRFLSIGGQRFWAKGVTYGSFRANDEGEPFPPFAQLLDDFAQMRDAGINVVRTYSPPSDRIADAAADRGLRLVPDICWGPRKCELDDSERLRFIFDWTRQHSRRLAGHPAMLLWCIGNEIPPLVVRWYGRERIERFLSDLAKIVRDEAPEALVTYVNHPPTEHLNLPFLDVVSYNVYLEREVEFRKYLARLQSLAGDRPVFLAELGLDSLGHGLKQQQRFLEWQLRAVFEKGVCGAAVYSWTDEWSIFSQQIDGWGFGLTDADRRPKPALETVRRVYRSNHYSLRAVEWPKVSVVVASYNGGRTLDECLGSLGRLTYPDYEVIVIDDGSTDNTPEIVARHDVRCVRTANGGLSRARNLGIESSTGEIVAFIDSDAYADPDWLYYLVTALREHNASAVGGPNLAPPEDGFTAACVDFAPGNPTHVLLDDERAEHVPGCNMAFLKDALAEIGGFDNTHRAAGDDVDVCWKLLVRAETIAFSPGAVVWHHRRPTVRAYLRQQRGYGFAEAHLKRRYPGRFNIFGDLVWTGSIYDGMHTELRQQGLPRLFQSRVYQGRFGSAPFQALYQPFQAWWFQVFTTAEWQVVSWCGLMAAAISFAFGGFALGMASLLVSLALVLATIGAAAVPAIHAVRRQKSLREHRLRALCLITSLHIMQPLARAWGHVVGWWKTRGSLQYPADQRVWGNLSQREIWLHRLEQHLRDCGWACRPSSDWDTADLDVLGPGPYRLQLCSVYEDDVEHGRHFVRFRVTTRGKRWLPLVWLAIVAAVPAFVVAPTLLPLAAPLGVLAFALAQSRRYMQSAVSQLALECGEPFGMTRAEID